MNGFRPIITLAGISLLLTTRALADPGAVELFDVAAEYNRTTGEIIISANEAIAWSVWGDEILTGPDHPLDAFEAVFGEYERHSESSWTSLDAIGGLVRYDASGVHHATFGPAFSYTDLNLGRVAATGLDADDFSFAYAAGSLDTVYGRLTVVPEPGIPVMLGAVAGGLGLLVWRRRWLADEPSGAGGPIREDGRKDP